MQLAFCQSDVASYAYNGTNLFEESGAVTDFSVVAALYMEQVQIVTLDPSIQSVADLKGKNVSIGAAGSGVYFNALDILGAYDLTEDDIKPVYQSFADSADSLKDGKIDAAFIVAGAPTTAITDLATGGKQVYLIGLDDAHIDALMAASPFYSKAVISADTYGLPGDVNTVAVGALVLARNDVADADVYNFVSSIFDNLEEVTAAHAKGAELSRYSSIRSSEKGYWNSFTPVLRFDSVDDYVSSVSEYVESGRLFSASEVYLPVRLKPRGVNCLENFKNGISHI